MARRIVFASVAATLWLSACTVQPPPQVDLRPGVSAPLPPLPALGRAWQASQLLTIQARGQQEQVPVQLELTPDALTLVALSPWGSRLLTVRYDGRRIAVEAEPQAATLPPPAHVVADVLLVNWPVGAWTLPAGWRLDQTADVRRLWDAQGQLVTEVRFPADPAQGVELRNPVFDYRLTIRTLQGDAPVR